MERRLLALRSVSVMTAPTRSRGFPMGTGSAAPECTSQEKLSFRFTQFAHEGSVCVHARERFGLVVAKKLNRRKKTSCVRGKGVSVLGDVLSGVLFCYFKVPTIVIYYFYNYGIRRGQKRWGSVEV